MTKYSQDYTTDELFLACLAREINDDDRVMYGVESALPFMAWMLAKETHAPHSSCSSLIGNIDSFPDKLPCSTGDPHMLDGAVCHVSIAEAVGLCRVGKLNLMFFSGGQLDKYGNLNNSVIGSYEQPKVRLPGGAGGAEITHLFPRYIIYRTVHNRKTFVERVDFITSAGWIKEVTWRRGGPEKIITNLAVMGFDPATKQMRVESVHPGVTRGDVIQNTGFDLKVPQKLSVTEPPTIEQVQLIRTKIDPRNLRKVQF